MENVIKQIEEAGRECLTCGEMKPFSDFYAHKGRKNGVVEHCRECVSTVGTEKYRTKDGFIRQKYISQKNNCRYRGDSMPTYSFDKFKAWILSQEEFDGLFNRWVGSGYDKNLSPSVDRKDDYKSYTLDNIQLMTWEENRQKANDDMKSGKNTKLSKSVIQFTKEGSFVKKHHSLRSAAREVNGSYSNITKCCDGQVKTSMGFRWSWSRKEVA